MSSPARPSLDPAPLLPENGPRVRPFVGREDELELISRAFDALLAGEPCAVCVIGEAGIGKTRLLEEVSALGEKKGVVTARGGASEGEAQPSLLPWQEVARELDAPIGQLFRFDGPSERHDRLHALASWFVRRSREQPLCIELDDLHWADPPSLLLLSLVVRQRAPLLVVGAWRASDAGRHPARFEQLERVRRHAETIDLVGLDPGSITRYFAERGQSVVEAEALRLREATGGNPFYIGEVERTWRREPGRLVLTDGVRGSVRQRLASLGLEERRLLELASVIGRRIPIDLLGEACELAQPELENALARASRGGFLERRSDHACEFVHDLMREAISEALEPGQRRAYHGSIANALMRRPATPDQAVQIFEHLAASGAGAAPLSPWAVQAAECRMKRGGYEAVVRIAERWAALPRGKAAPSEAPTLLALRAEALMRLGDVERGLAACAEAAELALQADDAVALGRVALARGLETPFSTVDTEHVALLEQALARVPESDVAVRLRLEARLASALQPTMEPARSHALARRAWRGAKDLGEPHTLAAVLCLARGAFRPLDDLEERYAMDRDALAVAEMLGNSEYALLALGRLVMDELERGDRQAAEVAMERCSNLAHEAGQSRALTRAKLFRAFTATLDGRTDEALATLERCADEVRWLPDRSSPLGHCRFQRLILSRWWGRRGELERARAAARLPYSVEGLRGSVEHWLGHRDRARAIYDRVAARPYPEHYVDLATRPELAAAYGNTVEVEAVYRGLVPFAGRHIVYWGTGGAGDGAVARLLGILAARLELWGDAEAHFEAALAANASLGAPAILARTREDFALALRQRGATAAARVHELEQAAAETYERLGMEVDQERLAAVASGRGRPRAPASQRATGPAVREDVATADRCGPSWLVRYRETTLTVPDGDGVRYLAYLLQHAHQSVHVLELASEGRGAGRPDAARRLGEMPEPTLDARAIRELRAKLRALAAEEQEAAAAGDAPRALAARHELEELTEAMTPDLGLSGRARKLRTSAERARVNLTQRIRTTIRRIAELEPVLGHHLDSCVKTGTFCRYSPPPERHAAP